MGGVLGGRGAAAGGESRCVGCGCPQRVCVLWAVRREHLGVEQVDVRALSGHTWAVMLLLSGGGKLISGSHDHNIRVWDTVAGRCEGVLEGHTGWLKSLAASEGRLLSGSADWTVLVWGMEGEASSW